MWPHVHAQMANYGYIWEKSKIMCNESSNVDSKNRHKLNARSSMALHEKLTKRKCNGNFSCGPMFMHKWPIMDLFGKGPKKYATNALMWMTKIGTSWMQGLQWYSMRKLTKRKCNWNFSCGPMFMHKWRIMDLFGKCPKKYATKALMWIQKIGTSWMQGLQWYSMRNSPKENVIENFHMAPCSCTNGQLWIYLG